jgi:hypothetical protein
MTDESLLLSYHDRLAELSPYRISGTVTEVTGILIASCGPWLPVVACAGSTPEAAPMRRPPKSWAFAGGRLCSCRSPICAASAQVAKSALSKEARYPVGDSLLGG